jgi:vancomycin resistance protein YoaR
MPWGYFEADGTAYVPDMDEYMTTISKKKEFVYPEGLATIAPEEMPAQIRYQYYRASYYYRDKNDGEVYIPKDANIARFKYTEESKGVDIDAQGLAELITASVESAVFGSIEVPVQITHTDTSVADAIYDTQLLTSWTSYLSHNDTSRVYNVAKLSGIINGVVIQPGEEWSINEEAGPRYASTGWKDAPGYTDGVSIDQPGGGVCQVSSTTYNAFLRAGLEYGDDIKSRRHSTVSDYIPIGLDATISTNGPDLVVINPYDYPIYIVSYMDGEAKNVTVEIYGRPLTDQNGKELIFEFSSKKTSTGDVPPVVFYYDQVQTPFKEPIPPGGYLEYGHSQAMIKANVYRTVYDIDGNIVQEKDLYYSASYPAKTGAIYCNFPQPQVSGDPLVPDPPPEVPTPTEPPAETGGTGGE